MKAKGSLGLCARNRAEKWMQAFGAYRDMERIEDHENDPELVVEHPYWRPEHTDRYLALVEANMELLRAIWPWEKTE